MRRRSHASACLVLVGSLFASARAASADPPPATDIVIVPSPTAAITREAVRAATALLPRKPRRIAVMDISTARPDVRERLAGLDAFTVAGNGVIYLVGGSELLRGAEKGSVFHRAALAAVIWHEMTHLEGGEEREARKAESTLWRTFVRDGLLDQLTALRYLNALEKRPDHPLLTSR